ncbi:MAG: XdhC family protein [Rhodospirillaceae bacterium]|nr:XdhC family protein [Rhodospirillaceae bacterium]
MKSSLFDSLCEALLSKHACATVSNLATDKQCFVQSGNAGGDLELSSADIQSVEEMIAADVSGHIAKTDLFVRVYGPNYRMIIVGAVHIAQALAPMAQLAGFDVTIIDPREAFVQASRLSDVASIREWPDDGVTKLEPDLRTAIVTLTHDPKLDDPALAAALKSDAFYIGSLGSKKTHAKRIRRLTEQGFTDADLSRIHGPVGLDIGAKTPSEIAVSILGEVVTIRRLVAA